MDDKSHKDRLDQFFGQSWDDQELSREMGTPDLEDAWGNIQEGLGPKRRAPLWLLFFLIPFIAGGVFLSMYYGGHNVDDQQATLPPNSAVSVDPMVREIPPEPTAINLSTSKSNTARADQITGTSEQNEIVSSASIGNDLVEDQIDETEEGVDEPGYRESKYIGASVVGANDQTASSEDPDLAVGNGTQDQVVVSVSDQEMTERLGALPIDLLYLEVFEPASLDLFPPDLFLSEGSRMGKSYKWNLQLTGGLGWHVFINNSDEASIDQVDVSFEDGHYVMAGLGASLEYRQNRKLDLGLGWRDHSFTSHYELGVKYTSSGEIQDGQGFWHQGYNHTLPTVFGDTPMEHVLIRGENDGLNEGEFIPFALYLEHEVKELNLSVGHSWDFPVRSWQISLGADLMGAYWYDKEQVSSLNLISHHDKVHHNRTEYTPSSPDLVRPWYLALGASVGIERNIIPNHKAGLRGRLQHSVITPILFHDIEYDAQFVDFSLYWKVSL